MSVATLALLVFAMGCQTNEMVTESCSDCEARTELDIIEALFGDVFSINVDHNDELIGRSMEVLHSKNSGSIPHPIWSDSRSLRSSSGNEILITPLPLSHNMSKHARHSDIEGFFNTNSLLLTISHDDELSHIVFDAFSNVTDANDVPEDLSGWDFDVRYTSLSGETILRFTNGGLEGMAETDVLNVVSYSKLEGECTADSWSDCVMKNIENAGAEILVCWVFAKFCAAGLAIGCTADVAFAVEREIYCD